MDTSNPTAPLKNACININSRILVLRISTLCTLALYTATLHIHIQADTMNSPSPSPTPTQSDTVSQEVRDINTANVFEHAHRDLASYRNQCQVYHVQAYEKQNPGIDAWANDLLRTLWTATTTRDLGWYNYPRVRFDPS
jgi:hypothetical protein